VIGEDRHIGVRGRPTLVFPLGAALFDCDGVLVDSRAAGEAAWTRWAAHYELHDRFDLAAIHGVRSRETAARYLAPEILGDAVELIERLEIDAAADTAPIHGARQLLETIPSALFAVVTSASERLCRARLAAAGLPQPEIIIASDDVAAGKPSPEGYLLAAQRLDVPAENCIIFEDSHAGIAAAQAAQARMVVGIGANALDRGCSAVIADLSAVSRVDGSLLLQGGARLDIEKGSP
jgi:sugar-phosphatase